MNFSEKISVEEVFEIQQNGERIFRMGFRKDLAINDLGVTLSGRAFRSNLFARSSQKGFPLQSLTQRQVYESEVLIAKFQNQKIDEIDGFDIKDLPTSKKSQSHVQAHFILPLPNNTKRAFNSLSTT